VWKIEFHSHCNEDPKDYISYSAEDLINVCISHGYHGLAITMHGSLLTRQAAYDYARSKNFLLIPGIEKWIEGKEVLLYNVTEQEVSGKMDFNALRNLREKRGNEIFVMAPHPYFPGKQCLHHKLTDHIDLFDAIEHCNFYLSPLNFNRKAVRVARRYNKPIVATGDIHHLPNLNRSYCLVDSPELSIPSIFNSLRENKITNTHRPIHVHELTAGITGMIHDKIRRVLGVPNH